MKITAKTTKQELKNILGANVKAVQKQDKDLYDRIAYASKMAKQDDSKVTRKDLVDLVKEVMKVLGDTLVVPALAEETPAEPPKAENSVKKPAKGLKSKKESVPQEVVESEQTAEETPAKEEKVDKKSAKKSLGSKKKAKKDDVAEPQKEDAQKEIFPETFEVSGNKYQLAHDIKTMDDLYNAVEGDNPEEIIFAFHWTKVDLKKYPYFYGMLDTPKSFEHDLDLASTLWVSPEKRIAYHISMYTEGCYNTLPDDFEEIDGIRYAGTMMFNVYRAV